MATREPKVYYGLHFYPGVAEYRPPDKDPYRVYIGEDTAKKMDPSFAAKPLFVRHVPKVDLANIQNEADGWVVESFYNKADGRHWAKFVIVSDRGHEAKSKGWTLSNSYIPNELGSGAVCNGVDYDREILGAEYNHMALVPDPRYEESVILTPEEFKEYNAKKELELTMLKNSKGDNTMGLNIFKRAKVDNSLDLEGLMVTLPKSKIDKSLSELVEIADQIQNMHGYANGDHMVKMGDEEMSVNDLVGKYGELRNKMDEADAAAKAKEEKGEGERKDNEAKKEEKPEAKKDNETETELAEKGKHDNSKSEEFFKQLQNAGGAIKSEAPVETLDQKVARGKSKYGSK